MTIRVFRLAVLRRRLPPRRPSSAASARAQSPSARSTLRARPRSNLRSPLPRLPAFLASSVSSSSLFVRDVLVVTWALFFRKIMALFRAPWAGRRTSPFAWTRPVWDTSLRLASKCSRISRCWPFKSPRVRTLVLFPSFRPRSADRGYLIRIPHRLPFPRT